MAEAVPIRLRVDRLPTPIGELALAADRDGRLCAVEWTDDDDRLQRSLRLLLGRRDLEITAEANPSGLTAALAAYFDGDLAAIDTLPVAEGGTPFQRMVWRALRQIPCGQTLSYGALARKIGRDTAVRAVGLANGANPISIVVPCHRVIGTDGSLTGYGGGIERKRWLLAHERVTLI